MSARNKMLCTAGMVALAAFLVFSPATVAICQQAQATAAAEDAMPSATAPPASELEPSPGSEGPPPSEQQTEPPLFGQRVFETAQLDYQPPTNLPPPDNYLLGPGDTLAVRVWGNGIQYHDLEVPVSSEGTIPLAVVGDFAVGGLTLAEARASITAAYRKFYPRAEVSVTVSRLRTIEVFVVGDVVRPGRYLLPGMATVFTALYAAGGPADSGSLRRITIQRAGRQVAVVDLYEYLLEGNTTADQPLQSGDTVFVPVIGDVVTISGEVKRPGRYELLPGTTLADALAMAGGLRATGYGRRVQITRVQGNSQRIVLDVDLLGQPGKWRQFSLVDGDEIVVLPVLEQPANTVIIEGEVERPGRYELLPGMTVAELIAKAEGLTESASRGTGHVLRKSPEGLREMFSFSVAAALGGDKTHNLLLEPDDIVQVYNVNEVAPPPKVSITGAVARPGEYDFYRGMRISDLVAAAGGPTSDAYGRIAHLLRRTAALEPELMTVNLAAALQHEPHADIKLQSQDRLVVYTRAQMAPQLKIKVSGAVAKPGEFELAANMRVGDALSLAGGLLPEAGDTALLIHGHTVGSARIEEIDISAVPAGGSPSPNVVLQDGDEIGVLAIGGYERQAQVVYVRGQVARPGAYPLRRDSAGGPMRVSELVALAGGLLESAYPQAATLYHAAQTMQAADERAQLVKQALQEAASAEPAAGRPSPPAAGSTASASPAGRTPPPADAGATAYRQVISSGTGRTRQATQRLVQVLAGEAGEAYIVVPPRELTAVEISSAIPVNLEQATAQPGGRQDVQLTAGDILYVPRRPGTVMVAGAVVSPGPLPYRRGWKLADYLAACGGKTADADLRHIAVVKYNGRAQNVKRVTSIDPGDYIIVPTRYSARKVGGRAAWERALDNLAQLATTLWLFRR